jgi:hypothetical protein
MKRTLLFFIVCGTAATLIISSCSKKNDTEAYTNKQLVGTYKLTASTATSAGATVDLMQYMDDCEKDDLLVLNADSTFDQIDAGVSCGNSDGSGTWVVSGNLIIVGGNDSSTIKSFNGKTLVLSQTEIEQGKSVVETTTMTKQ